MPRLPFTTIVLAATLLAGCDMIGGALGIESPEKVAAAREADGKAIGGACRHAGPQVGSKSLPPFESKVRLAPVLLIPCRYYIQLVNLAAV